MIQKHELKIGIQFMVNWSKEIRTADWMDIRDIADNLILNGVSGIPITEDVLKGCGFLQFDRRSGERWQFLNGYYAFPIFDCAFAAGYEDGQWAIYHYSNSLAGDFVDKVRDVSYLHQIQNFASSVSDEAIIYKKI